MRSILSIFAPPAALAVVVLISFAAPALRRLSENSVAGVSASPLGSPSGPFRSCVTQPAVGIDAPESPAACHTCNTPSAALAVSENESPWTATDAQSAAGRAVTQTAPQTSTAGDVASPLPEVSRRVAAGVVADVPF